MGSKDHLGGKRIQNVEGGISYAAETGPTNSLARITHSIASTPSKSEKPAQTCGKAFKPEGQQDHHQNHDHLDGSRNAVGHLSDESGSIRMATPVAMLTKAMDVKVAKGRSRK